MPTVDWNRQAWGQKHTWESRGDEWSGMAAHCGQPYEEWKRSLIATFIDARIGPDADIVEIAPGHGRWTEHLLRRARRLDIVDINQSCLDACAERFAADDRLVCHLTGGSSLSFLDDASTDFIWSFDAFVHMDADVVRSYIAEFARILRPGGQAVIHHANLRPWSLPLVPVTRRLGLPGRVALRLAAQGRLRDNGSRSTITASHVAGWAHDAGLTVQAQTQSWGDREQYNVAKYHDTVSVLSK